jgi:hypothetical protein
MSSKSGWNSEKSAMRAAAIGCDFSRQTARFPGRSFPGGSLKKHALTENKLVCSRKQRFWTLIPAGTSAA